VRLEEERVRGADKEARSYDRIMNEDTMVILSPDLYSGRGQPLSLALSFGETPWFGGLMMGGEYGDVIGFKKAHSLKIHTDTGHIQKNELSDQSQRCISPRTLNHGIRPKDSANDSGRPSHHMP
jgi:hypothetical protein